MYKMKMLNSLGVLWIVQFSKIQSFSLFYRNVFYFWGLFFILTAKMPKHSLFIFIHLIKTQSCILNFYIVMSQIKHIDEIFIKMCNILNKWFSLFIQRFYVPVNYLFHVNRYGRHKVCYMAPYYDKYTINKDKMDVTQQGLQESNKIKRKKKQCTQVFSLEYINKCKARSNKNMK